VSDDRGAARAVGCLVRSKGATVLAGGLLGAALLWFITGRFRIILERQGLDAADAPGVARMLIEWRTVFLGLALLAAGGGLLGLVRPGRAGVAGAILGFAILLGLVGAVLVGFVQLLAPLYDVQPL
jgi:hypothetical protein